MSFYCLNTILSWKIGPCIKNIWFGYGFFSFCAVNFCEASACTVNIPECMIKTFTFEWIIVGKYGNSKEKCKPDSEWYVFLSFHFYFPKVNVRFVKDVRLLDQKRGQCLKPEKHRSGRRSANHTVFCPQSREFKVCTPSPICACLGLGCESVNTCSWTAFWLKNNLFISYYLALGRMLSINCGSMNCLSFQNACRGVSVAWQLHMLFHISFTTYKLCFSRHDKKSSS